MGVGRMAKTWVPLLARAAGHFSAFTLPIFARMKGAGEIRWTLEDDANVVVQNNR
jgi:hypothetical protein